MGDPFLAKVNGVTVGKFLDEEPYKVQRFEDVDSCTCAHYLNWPCDDFVYAPENLECLGNFYTFGDDNDLSVDGLLYNTSNSIFVTVEVCPVPAVCT